MTSTSFRGSLRRAACASLCCRAPGKKGVHLGAGSSLESRARGNRPQALTGSRKPRPEFASQGIWRIIGAPFDAKVRLRGVEWRRWGQCSSKFELWEADSGQALGDTPLSGVPGRCPDRPQEGAQQSWPPRHASLIHQHVAKRVAKAWSSRGVVKSGHILTTPLWATLLTTPAGSKHLADLGATPSAGRRALEVQIPHMDPCANPSCRARSVSRDPRGSASSHVVATLANS